MFWIAKCSDQKEHELAKSSQNRVDRRTAAAVPAYKFFRSQDLQYVKEHSIRLGSAKEYREADGEEGGLTDRFESMTCWFPGQTEIDGYHPFVVETMGKPMPGLRIIMGSDAGVVMAHHAIMYCASLSIDDEICERMWTKFGYDKYYKILNIMKFANVLAKDMRQLGIARIGEVFYDWSDNNKDWPDNMFRKRLVYSWQKEIRIVWERRTEPFLITRSKKAFRHVSGIFDNPAAKLR